MKKRARNVERFDPRTGGDSPLKQAREARGVTQEALAAAIGVSIRTYRRLENGEIDDPGFRVLNNCAIALGVSLWEIVAPTWTGWTPFNAHAAQPPNWEELFEQPDATTGELTVCLDASVYDAIVKTMRSGWLKKREDGLSRLWTGKGKRRSFIRRLDN